MNQVCGYGDTLVWMKGFSNIGSVFGIFGLSGLRHKVWIKYWCNRVVYHKSKVCYFLARSQVSGSWDLVGGIDEKLSKSLAVVWHFWTYNIRIQRTKCLFLSAKVSLELTVCPFRFLWRKLIWYLQRKKYLDLVMNQNKLCNLECLDNHTSSFTNLGI